MQAGKATTASAARDFDPSSSPSSSCFARHCRPRRKKRGGKNRPRALLRMGGSGIGRESKKGGKEEGGKRKLLGVMWTEKAGEHVVGAGEGSNRRNGKGGRKEKTRELAGRHRVVVGRVQLSSYPPEFSPGRQRLGT